MKYLTIIEKTKTGDSPYSPDLQGCIATGSKKREVEELMKEAIEFHIQGLKEEGYDIPLPQSYSHYVEV